MLGPGGCQQPGLKSSSPGSIGGLGRDTTGSPRPLLPPGHSVTTRVAATTEQGAACLPRLPALVRRKEGTLHPNKIREGEGKPPLCQTSLWKLAAARSRSASCHQVAVGTRQEPRSLTNQPFSFLLEIKTAEVPGTTPSGKQDSGGVGAIYTSRGGRNRAASGPTGGCGHSRLRGAGAGGSVAEGDGFHVKEAHVHLGLDVYPLPDLQRTEQHEHVSPPWPGSLPGCPPARPATRAGENQRVALKIVS